MSVIQVHRAVVVALFAIGVAGCAVGPDFRAPPASTEPTYLPGQPAVMVVGGAGSPAQHFDRTAAVPPQWWREFRSDALDALVQRALDASPGLGEAQARLRQAQALMQVQADSTRLPSLDATASVTRQKIDPAALGFINVPLPPAFNLYNASVDAGYTFDLFGANRRTLEGLRAQVDYQRFELDAARLTLAGNVVTATIRSATLASQIAATRELLATQRRQLQINQTRRRAGAISELTLHEQTRLLALTESQLPPLQKQQLQLRHQLAIYLGEAPAAAHLPVLDLDGLTLPEQLPLRVPSTLARQRPDVRAVEAQLHAANAAIGVATANLYPQITLVAHAGSERISSADLADGINVWSLGAKLMQPLFHGGALRAGRRSAVAAYDAAAADYRLTVLRALQQVADVLVALDQDARALQAQATADQQAQAARAIAEAQYRLGGISELMLLDARREQLQTRIQRLGAMGDRFVDTAALFQSLGGGWAGGAAHGPDGGTVQ